MKWQNEFSICASSFGVFRDAGIVNRCKIVISESHVCTMIINYEMCIMYVLDGSEIMSCVHCCCHCYCLYYLAYCLFALYK